MYSFLSANTKTHPVSAAVDEVKLKEYVASLEPKYRMFLFSALPRLTSDWIGGTSGTEVKEVNPKLNLASIHTPGDFNYFLTTWAQLRTISPPTVSNATVYRLTRALEVPTTPSLIFTNKNQNKAATSWSLAKSPKVQGRQRATGGKIDIILKYDLQGTKHVLWDFRSVRNLVSSMQKDLPYYFGTYPELAEIDKKITAGLGYLYKDLEREAGEKEVVIYLNAGEKLECEWRKV